MLLNCHIHVHCYHKIIKKTSILKGALKDLLQCLATVTATQNYLVSLFYFFFFPSNSCCSSLFWLECIFLDEPEISGLTEDVALAEPLEVFPC